ncbi:MAG: transposase, partial [Burkholderia sp.]
MKPTKKPGRRAKLPLTVVGKQEHEALPASFAEHEQLWLPMRDLIQNTRISVDALMYDAGRALVEQLLMVSAREVAGDKHAGRAAGDVRWHGSQPGRIVMDERKLRDKRGKEVPIRAYTQLRDDERLTQRMYDIMVSGVSTRKYDEVLPEIAHTVGISKSSVSREFVKASKKKLDGLTERRFEDHDILAIYLDGIIVDGCHILTAIGVESDAQKHLMGLASGSSENAEVVKDLLNSLIERGLATDRDYLFVIDGSKALRSAIQAVFGELAHVQRCRTHKIRNATERLPKQTRQQVASVMSAAYKLPADDGLVRLKAQAAWLKTDHPDATASLLEGLEETFTVNRLDLTPRLIRSL